MLRKINPAYINSYCSWMSLTAGRDFILHPEAFLARYACLFLLPFVHLSIYQYKYTVTEL